MILTSHDLHVIEAAMDRSKLSYREQTEIQYIMAKLWKAVKSAEVQK